MNSFHSARCIPQHSIARGSDTFEVGTPTPCQPKAFLPRFSIMWLALLLSFAHAINAAAQSLPGHSAVAKYLDASNEGELFTSFVTPQAITPTGQVFFGQGFSPRGIYMGSNRSWKTITSEGQQAPGGGVIRPGFGSNAFWPTSSGNTVYLARIRLPTSAVDTTGLFLYTGGKSYLIANNGLSAPGGGVFSNLSGYPATNASGSVAFYSTTSGGPGSGIYRSNLNAGTPVLQKIAVAGDVAPGTRGNFTSFKNSVALNDAGLLLFCANTSDGSSYTLFSWDGNTVNEVPNAGSSGYYRLNNQGQILTGGNYGDDLALGDASGVQATIIEGYTKLPDGAYVSYVNSYPVLNEVGWFAFSCYSYSDYKTRLVLKTPGTMKVIAKEGDPAPGGGVFQALSSVPVALNDNGIIYFRAKTSNTYPNNPRIFMGDGKELVPVAGVGDTLDGNSLDDVTLFSQSNDQTHSATTRPVNNAGQLAYHALFSNYAGDGVYVYTPTSRWWKGGGGDWESPSYWQFGFVPGPNQDVQIDPSITSTIAGPLANTTVKTLSVGGGSGVTTLVLTVGSVLTTTKGSTINPNAVVTGLGALAGDLIQDGTQEVLSTGPTQTLAACTYTNRSHTAFKLLNNDTSAGLVSTSSLTINSGAVIDLVLNGAASAVDVSDLFYDVKRVWHLFTSKAIHGTFVLGQVSPDSAGQIVLPSRGAFSLRQTPTAVDLLWTPHQVKPSVSAPDDQLIAVGSATSFGTFATGGALSLQWRKNSATIKGATNDSLTLPQVSLADAGIYSVTASNDAGSTPSLPVSRLVVANRAIIAPTVGKGGTLVLAMPIAAPTGTILTYQWTLDSTLLANGALDSGAIVAGSGSSRLSISHVTKAEQGSYICQVFMGGLSLDSMPVNVIVFNPPTITTATVPSAEASATFSWQLTADESPTSFATSALPAGLSLNATTGLISGIPNLGGSYKVNVSARNVAGTGVMSPFTLIVSSLPIGTVGNFSGLVQREGSLNSKLGGSISLSVSPAGTFTGALKNGTSAYTLIGRLVADG